MASAIVKWQLKKTSARLRVLRDELRLIDEQRMYVVDDADDLELRAVVSDSPMSRSEAQAAGGHAAAYGKARQHIIDEIVRRDAQLDKLLDRLSTR